MVAAVVQAGVASAGSGGPGGSGQKGDPVAPWSEDADEKAPDAGSSEPPVDAMTADSTLEGPAGIPGSVTWEIPSEILALDSGRPEAKDIRIPGFRVHCSWANSTAPGNSRGRLKKELDDPIYVTPYPPLFGVTVGNYTIAGGPPCPGAASALPQCLGCAPRSAARRRLPAGNSPAHGPHLPPTHRD